MKTLVESILSKSHKAVSPETLIAAQILSELKEAENPDIKSVKVDLEQKSIFIEGLDYLRIKFVKHCVAEYGIINFNIKNIDSMVVRGNCKPTIFLCSHEDEKLQDVNIFCPDNVISLRSHPFVADTIRFECNNCSITCYNLIPSATVTFKKCELKVSKGMIGGPREVIFDNCELDVGESFILHNYDWSRFKSNLAKHGLCTKQDNKYYDVLLKNKYNFGVRDILVPVLKNSAIKRNPKLTFKFSYDVLSQDKSTRKEQATVVISSSKDNSNTWAGLNDGYYLTKRIEN